LLTGRQAIACLLAFKNLFRTVRYEAFLVSNGGYTGKETVIWSLPDRPLSSPRTKVGLLGFGELALPADYIRAARPVVLPHLCGRQMTIWLQNNQEADAGS
jgi:hypothetical protein